MPRDACPTRSGGCERPLCARARKLLADAGVDEYAWLPGKRDDIAPIMRSFDLFVLPF
jgi:hypothetical protein